MTANEYQKWTRTTFEIESGTAEAWMYLVMGLAGEAGEVANEMKRIIRDDNMVPRIQRIWKVHEELGDVLWYTARLADELVITLDQLMIQNKRKLQKRYKK